MRSLNLTVSSPPQSFIEPLTLAEVKQYLQIEQTSPADTTDDDLIDSLIGAARDYYEIKQGYDLVQKQYDLTDEEFGDKRIELRDRLVSVDLVRYRDSDGAYTILTEGVDYIVDATARPGIIYSKSWPSFTSYGPGAVLIRFTAGPSPTDAFWNDHGKLLKAGMKVYIKSLYLADEPDNRSGVPWASQVISDYGAIPRSR